MSVKWPASWSSESHGSAWDRVKEAMKRDWEQTKHDLGSPAAHALNQCAGDTLQQAFGNTPIPSRDRPTLRKSTRPWEEVELPISYGYGARRRYGDERPVWNEGIELRIRSEWESSPVALAYPWQHVRILIRHGYEYEEKP